MIVTDSVEVGSTPVALNEAAGATGCTLLVQNAGPETVELGGDGVMFGSGLILTDEDQPLELRLEPASDLYAISAQDITTLRVLRT